MRAWVVLCVLVPASVSLADELELTTGEVLHGRLIEQAAEVNVFDHSILGRLEIPADEVRALRIEHTAPPGSDESAPPGPPDGAADDRVDLPAPTPQPPPVAPISPPPAESPWDSRFELGFGVSEGTTQDSNLRLAFTTSLQQETQSCRIDTSYQVRTSRGDRSENKYTAGLFAEWPQCTSRWNYFVQTRYDFDEFQSWEHRITAGGGVGHHLIDVNRQDEAAQPIDVFDLTVRLGAGGRQEFRSQNEGLQPEGILGGDIAWHISPRQQLSAVTTLFSNLRDTGEFRVRSTVEWILDLDTLDGMSLKLGLVHEYQSETDPGIDPHDLSVYGALVIDF